jgi:hypothetical protein
MTRRCILFASVIAIAMAYLNIENAANVAIAFSPDAPPATIKWSESM